MPFREIYSVDFSDGRLIPDVDVNGWGNMATSMPPNPDPYAPFILEQIPDPEGFIFRVTRFRREFNPANLAARLSVFVTPDQTLPLNSRLRLQAVFDDPAADGYDENNALRPVSYGGHPDDGLTRPEPWAVGVVLSPHTDLSDDTKIVTTTCQFNNKLPKGGVWLNTPRSLQNGPNDPQVQYLAPLDYYWFGLEGGYPKFIVENFFCGFDASEADARRVCGFGTFKLDTYAGEPEVRAYSSNVFQKAGNTPIGALGISLVTQSGEGRFKVRLRSFKVWEPVDLSTPTLAESKKTESQA